MRPLSQRRGARHACAALALTGAVLDGCQMVAGIESRKADPLLESCVLPASGDARVRLANLLPAEGAVDFCIKPSAAASYARPVLRGAGVSCPAGVPFKSVTVPFRHAVESVDIKVVPAGAGGCGAAALSELKSVALAADTTTTIARIGGNGEAERIVAYPESTPGSTLQMKVRFMNAIGGVGPVFFGLVRDARLPTEVTPYITSQGIGFGALPATGPVDLGNIDDRGYFVTTANDYRFGVSLAGGRAAIIAHQVRGPRNISFFAVGDPSNPRFPVRAVVCDEASNGEVFAPCAQSDPPSLTVDVFNVGLYGAYAPQEDARRDYLIEALAKNDADVMCLAEVGRASDREAFARRAAETGAYPFAALPQSDLSTLPGDPTDATGVAPPRPTRAPCDTPAALRKAEEVYSCLDTTCSTSPGSPAATLIRRGGPDCAQSQCAAEFTPLLAGDRDDKRCFNCIIGSLFSFNSLGDVRAECNEDVNGGHAFKGQTPTMILSKFPLKDVETWVLPSTMFRRSVVRARVELEADDAIDFYCLQLSSIQGALTPYTGSYGGGALDETGWKTEQIVQANKVVSYVKSKSAQARAIIAGDFASSEEFKGQGSSNIAALNPDAVAIMKTAFAEAVPPAYTPVCTNCAAPENAYGGSPPGLWTARAYLHGFGPSPVTSASRHFTEAVVPLPDKRSGQLSDIFAYRVKVLRR